MFKARGQLAILNDKKVREITVDNGKITGDDVLKFEVMYELKKLEKHGDYISPAFYKPSTKAYHTDNLAVLLMLGNICTNLEVEGDIPELPYEEGVDY